MQVDAFSQKVETIKKRFSNLVSDVDKRIKHVDKNERSTKDIITTFREELLC